MCSPPLGEAGIEMRVYDPGAAPPGVEPRGRVVARFMELPDHCCC